MRLAGCALRGTRQGGCQALQNLQQAQAGLARGQPAAHGFARVAAPDAKFRRKGRTHRLAVAAKGGDRSDKMRKEMEELERERKGVATPAAPKSKGFGARARAPQLMEVLQYPDPRLRAPNAPVTVFDAKLAQLAKDMFHTMYMTEGIGLAAPQVGQNICMMVYNEGGHPDDGEEVVLLNPKIVEYSKEEDFFEEGCLSFPKTYADVKRPLKITVEYDNLAGKRVRMQLDELAARVFQHEYDHLEGVLFHDRMDAANLDKVREDLRTMEEAGEARGWKVEKKH